MITRTHANHAAQQRQSLDYAFSVARREAESLPLADSVTSVMRVEESIASTAAAPLSK